MRSSVSQGQRSSGGGWILHPWELRRSRKLTVNEKSFSLGLLDPSFILDKPAETMALSSAARHHCVSSNAG